jgi:hypothetical protein
LIASSTIAGSTAGLIEIQLQRFQNLDGVLRKAAIEIVDEDDHVTVLSDPLRDGRT